MEQCIATSVNCRCLKAPHSTDEAHQCEHGSWGGQRYVPDAERIVRAEGVRDERARILVLIAELRAKAGTVLAGEVLDEVRDRIEGT